MASVEPNSDLTADEIRRAVLQLSERHGTPGVDLALLVLSLEDLDLIPAEIARRHAVLPILVKDEAVFLAMADPSDKRVIEEIEFISGKRVFPYVSSPSQLVSTIERAYQMHHDGQKTLIGDRAAKGARAAVIQVRHPVPDPDPDPGPGPDPDPDPDPDPGPDPDESPDSGTDSVDDRTVMTEAVTPAPFPIAQRASPPVMKSVRPTMISMRAGMVASAPPSIPSRIGAQSSPTPVPPASAPLYPPTRAVMLAPPEAPTLLPDAPPLTVLAPPDTSRSDHVPPVIVPRRGSYPVVPSAALRVRNALVVDAQDDSRKLLASALEDLGLTVHEAARGALAIAIAQRHTLELVVLDASLPDVHGFEVCQKLMDIPSMAEVPVVMLSSSYRGWRYSADVRAVFGVRALLEKPFGILDFASKIESILAGTDLLPPQPESLEREADEALRQANEAYRGAELDLAISHLERAVALAPGSARVHYQLALLLGRRGEIFRAITALETSVGLNDSFFPALKNLAVLYDKAGFVRKAVESWERALWAAPDVETHKQIKERLLSLL